MARSYTTNAINLTSYDFSENDKIILMYSKERGLIRGIARGCKKPKSKLGATMQSLVANRIIMNKGRNLDIISQAEALDSFKKLKEDLDKLSLSMYCAEIVSNYGVEEDTNSDAVYDMLLQVLRTISDSKTKEELLICVLKFQLKIMDMFGLRVNLGSCSNCSCELDENKNYKFSISSGGILCNHCFENLTDINGKIVSVHSKIIKFLDSLSKTDFNEKTEYDNLVTQKICIVCFNLLKDYISYYCSKKFKTFDMLELCNS